VAATRVLKEGDMASWTNDARLHGLMRVYLAAVARLDLARENASPPEVVDRLVNEKRVAAQSYEEALVARGWQIPGLAIGPMARASRW
jgi:hypothetical protein